MFLLPSYMWEMLVLLPLFIMMIIAVTTTTTTPREVGDYQSTTIGVASSTSSSRARVVLLRVLYRIHRRLQRLKDSLKLKKKGGTAATSSSSSKLFQFNLGAFMKIELILSVVVVGWLLYLHGALTSLDSNSTVGLHTLTNATTYIGCSHGKCTVPLTIYTSWNLACVVVLSVMWYVGIVSSSGGRGAAIVADNTQRSSTLSSSASSREQPPVLLIIPQVPTWACVWNFPSTINVSTTSITSPSSSSSFSATSCISTTVPSPGRYILALVCRMLGCALVSWFSLQYRTIPSFSILVATIPNIEVVVRCVLIGMLYRGVIVPWVLLGRRPSDTTNETPQQQQHHFQNQASLSAEIEHLIEGVIDRQFERCKATTTSSVLGALICSNRWFIGASTIAAAERLREQQQHRGARSTSSGHVGLNNNDVLGLFFHRRSTLCLVGEVMCGVGLTDTNLTRRLGFQPAYTDTVQSSISMTIDTSTTASTMSTTTTNAPGIDVTSWSSINTPSFACQVANMVVQYKHTTAPSSRRMLGAFLYRFCIGAMGGFLLISSLLPFVFSTTLTLTSIFFPGSALYTDQHEWVYGGSSLFNSVFTVMMVFGAFQCMQWVLLAALPLLVEIREVRKLRAKQFGRRRRDPQISSSLSGNGNVGSTGGLPSPPLPSALSSAYPPPPTSSLWTEDRRPTHVNSPSLPPPPKYINPNHAININHHHVDDNENGSRGGSGGSRGNVSIANVFERLMLTLISQEVVPLAVMILRSEGILEM